MREWLLSIFTITAGGMFRYSEDSCQNLLDCVETGIPVEIVPVMLMGLIAPVTLMGAPVLFGGAPAVSHMKAAASPMIAVESLQLDLAYVAGGQIAGIADAGVYVFERRR